MIQRIASLAELWSSLPQISALVTAVASALSSGTKNLTGYPENVYDESSSWFDSSFVLVEFKAGMKVSFSVAKIMRGCWCC